MRRDEWPVTSKIKIPEKMKQYDGSCRAVHPQATFPLHVGITWNSFKLSLWSRPRTCSWNSLYTDLFVPCESEPHTGHSTMGSGSQDTFLRGSESITGPTLQLPSSYSSTIPDYASCWLIFLTGPRLNRPDRLTRFLKGCRVHPLPTECPQSHSRVDELAEETSHPILPPRSQRKRRPPVR